MALIKIHEFEPRRRIFFEKMINTNQVTEVSALEPGCGYDGDFLFLLHQLGCNTMLVSKETDKAVILIAETIQILEKRITDTNEVDFSQVLAHYKLWGQRRVSP